MVGDQMGGRRSSFDSRANQENDNKNGTRQRKLSTGSEQHLSRAIRRTSIDAQKSKESLLTREQLARLHRYFNAHSVQDDNRLTWDQFMVMKEDIPLHMEEGLLQRVGERTRNGTIGFTDFINMFNSLSLIHI